VAFTGQALVQVERASTLAGTAWIVEWKPPSAGGGRSSVVMIDRLRNSGGVACAAAKPLDPTGSTRVPSQAGAAVASPMRLTDGLGSVAEVAVGALDLPASASGAGLGDVPEQAAATPQASRAVNSRLIGSHTDVRCRPGVVVMSLAISLRSPTLSFK
jgi:hypothetical protein